MRGKRQQSGFIIPETEIKFQKKIADFPVVSPQEFYQFMVVPIQHALDQGIPPETPSAVPLEAMARLIHTVQNMANILNQTSIGLGKIATDSTLSEEHKEQIKNLPIFSHFKSIIPDDAETSEENNSEAFHTQFNEFEGEVSAKTEDNLPTSLDLDSILGKTNE